MKNKFFLSTTCMAVCIGMLSFQGSPARAQEMGTLHYYNLTDAEIRDHYNEWRVFLEYNLKREQCQHYQDPPVGYVMKGCHVYRVDKVKPVVSERVTKTVQPVSVAQEDSASSYTIHFARGKFNIPDGERGALEHVAREIKKYNPSQVIVSGYASTLGSTGDNMILSENRARTVARALSNLGVSAEIINLRAHGETQLKVETGDGVMMPPNRRVLIEFNH